MKFPKIGTEICGGLFAGIVAGEVEDKALILIHGETEGNWDACVLWADILGVRLPTGKEQMFLYATFKSEFGEGVYWSIEKSSDNKSCALIRDFDDGMSYYALKSNEHRARAVRTIPMTEFMELLK